jgi:hypothetical protein
MLEGPISNIGVRGIRKAAKKVLEWPKIMNDEELRWSCFNTYIFIDAEGGTGGGIFRYMYGRFLEEAAGVMGNKGLAQIGEEMRVIGDKWQEVAAIFKRGSRDTVAVLPETTEPMMEIADLEEESWRRLREII